MKTIEYSEFLLQKFRFQNLGSLFFKHFSAKNIPFKIASPKMGNFIDWNFRLTILGDVNGYLLYYGAMPWFYVLVTIL